MVNTRLSAVKALLEIFQKGARPKKAIASEASFLDGRDRAFLMEIVYGVLRFRDTLDYIMKGFLKNPAKLGNFTTNNLRTALYQIFFMRVPFRAVVFESVELEKVSDRGAHGRAALVNAVLRNVIRQKDRLELPLILDDVILSTAVNTSHPLWMIRRWVEMLGSEEAVRLAEANNAVPPLTIRVNTLKTTREGLLDILASKGIGAGLTEFSPDGIILKEVSSYEDLSFLRGNFLVQDEASQLIAFLLGPRRGECVLDACAAPGGKTTHLAQLMGDSGEVVAVEKDPERIQAIRENVETLGIKSVKIINADAYDLNYACGFDRILVDAPCSATGVIRRNPDVKYRHRRGDFAAFGEKQVKLLESVSKLLREGGMLLYSVCSVEPEEGEGVVKEFLKTHDDFRIIDAERAFLENMRDRLGTDNGGTRSAGELFDRGFFRTYPHRNAMDGFFGALLCKKR